MSLLQKFTFTSTFIQTLCLAVTYLGTQQDGTPAPVPQPTKSPITGPACGKNVKFTTQTESQLWWLSFYVEDLCCGTVTKVEVKDGDLYPSFVTGQTQYDYWYFDNGGNSFTAPITVRVTNSDNQVLTFTDILESVDPDNIYYADTNFCGSSATKSVNPTGSPTTQPSKSPTDNPSFKPTVSPFLPGSPTNAPTDPTPKPTNNPTKMPTDNPLPAGKTKHPSMNPTGSPAKTVTVAPSGSPTTSPTDMQCDDSCKLSGDEDNDSKLRIKIIFTLPNWILYDFTYIECWFYNIFVKWFDVFYFAKYFTECDIDIIVYGGHEHLGDNLCIPEPCLRNKHDTQIRRMLLQKGNDGNISISIISEDDDTYYVMTSFSLERMSLDIENKFINDFDLDLVVTTESVQADEDEKIDDSNKNDKGGSATGVIIVVVVILIILVIIVGVFLFIRYRKKKVQKTDDITGTEMIGGEGIGQSKPINSVATDDNDEEEDVGVTNYNDEEDDDDDEEEDGGLVNNA